MNNSTSIPIDSDLLGAASAEGAREGRTPAAQIEHWASLGRAVDGLLSPSELLALRAGILCLQPVPTTPVAADEVFCSVDEDRTALAQELARRGVAYQASPQRPGYLEAVYPDGRVVVGQFRHGVFVPRFGLRLHQVADGQRPLTR